jgi:hypothetical protein
MVSNMATRYDGGNRQGETVMFRITPFVWSAIHVGVVSAATWLVVASDLLDSAPLFFIH